MALLLSGPDSHSDNCQASDSSEQPKTRLEAIEGELEALHTTIQGIHDQLKQEVETSTEPIWSLLCIPCTPGCKGHQLLMQQVDCFKKQAALREERTRLKQQAAVAICPSRSRPADEPPPLGPTQPSTEEAPDHVKTGHAATQVAHQDTWLCSQDTQDTKLDQSPLVQVMQERDERHPQLRHRLVAGSVVREGDGANQAGL